MYISISIYNIDYITRMVNLYFISFLFFSIFQMTSNVQQQKRMSMFNYKRLQNANKNNKVRIFE